MTEPAIPPVEFMLDASEMSLQDLELAALARSADFGKALRAELHQWIEQRAIAMLARWMREHRRELLSALTVQTPGRLEELFEERKKTA